MPDMTRNPWSTNRIAMRLRYWVVLSLLLSSPRVTEAECIGVDPTSQLRFVTTAFRGRLVEQAEAGTNGHVLVFDVSAGGGGRVQLSGNRVRDLTIQVSFPEPCRGELTASWDVNSAVASDGRFSASVPTFVSMLLVSGVLSFQHSAAVDGNAHTERRDVCHPRQKRVGQRTGWIDNLPSGRWPSDAKDLELNLVRWSDRND